MKIVSIDWEGFEYLLFVYKIVVFNFLYVLILRIDFVCFFWNKWEMEKCRFCVKLRRWSEEGKFCF